MDTNINEAVLRAVSAAADMADETPIPDPAVPEEVHALRWRHSWHRAFIAELGEQGYYIVTAEDHEVLRMGSRCSTCNALPTDEEDDSYAEGYAEHAQWEAEQYNRELEAERLGRPLFPNEY